MGRRSINLLKSKDYNYTAELCLLTTAVIWGFNIPLVKQITQTVQPFSFHTARVVISTLTLAVIILLDKKKRVFSNFEQATWIRLFIFSLLTGLAYHLFFMSGIARTTSINTALLLSSLPMWTALFAFVFLRERLPFMTWIGLGLTILGAFFIIKAKGKIDFSQQHFNGNLLILGATITWTVATLISPPLFKKMSPIFVTFVASLFSTPIFLLFFFEDMWTQIEIILQPSNIAVVVYSGMLSTGIAYYTWNVGVSALGASYAAVYQNVVTLVAVLGGWFYLQERPTMVQWFGGILIVFGIALTRRGRKGAPNKC